MRLQRALALGRFAQSHQARVWRKVRLLLIGSTDPGHLFSTHTNADTLRVLLAAVTRAVASKYMTLEAVESPQAPWHGILQAVGGINRAN